MLRRFEVVRRGLDMLPGDVLMYRRRVGADVHAYYLDGFRVVRTDALAFYRLTYRADSDGPVDPWVLAELDGVGLFAVPVDAVAYVSGAEGGVLVHRVSPLLGGRPFWVRL